VPVEQGRRRALDLARNGEVAERHLAHHVVEIDHEGLGQRPPERLGIGPFRGDPAQSQHEVQRDHLEPPLDRIGHAEARVEHGLARPGHNRAINRSCNLPAVASSLQPIQHVRLRGSAGIDGPGVRLGEGGDRQVANSRSVR
jgi:hypothetical protein